MLDRVTSRREREVGPACIAVRLPWALLLVMEIRHDQDTCSIIDVTIFAEGLLKILPEGGQGLTTSGCGGPVMTKSFDSPSSLTVVLACK